MRRLFSTLAVAALLGFGTVGAANAAGSASLAPQGIVSTDNLITQVGSPCGRWGCGGRYDRGRHYRGDSSRTWRRHWDHDWRDRYHSRRYWHSRPSFQLYIQPRVIPRYVQPRTVYRLSSAHVAWCHARYRSYRSWDNSWQPYHGPRRSCVSPFS